MNYPFSFVNINNPDRHLNLREALNAILADQRASREQLADDLHISLAQLDIILEASDPADLEECVAALPYDGEGWVSVSPNEGDAFEPDDVGQWVEIEPDDVEERPALKGRLATMFSKYGVLVHENHDARGEPTTAVAFWKTDQANNDPFGSSAEDISAEETREKVALFEWADQALGLGEAELELKLDEAAKRFKRTRGTLKQLIKARRSDKKRREEARSRPHDAPEDDVRYYGPDFRVSKRGVFARRIDSEGTPFWERISTTRMDIEALTRDARARELGDVCRHHQQGWRHEKAGNPKRSYSGRQGGRDRGASGLSRSWRGAKQIGPAADRPVPHDGGDGQDHFGSPNWLA